MHFPDFTNPVTRDWWVKHIKEWRKVVEWDGIWIDMNEPSNFDHGSVDGCEENAFNNPPYMPNHNR